MRLTLRSNLASEQSPRIMATSNELPAKLCEHLKQTNFTLGKRESSNGSRIQTSQFLRHSLNEPERPLTSSINIPNSVFRDTTFTPRGIYSNRIQS